MKFRNAREIRYTIEIHAKPTLDSPLKGSMSAFAHYSEMRRSVITGLQNPDEEAD